MGVIIYLDNYCFNRPFDDQSLIRNRLETEAKFHITESEDILFHAEKLLELKIKPKDAIHMGVNFFR